MRKFKRIYIEITNCCNLKCSFCPESKRGQGFMEVQDFEQILNKIKGYGEYVYLHIKGEPLLHPKFSEILELCQQYNLKVNLTTNGTLLRKNMELILNSKALRQISVSLQSFENLEDSDGFQTYLNDVLFVVKEGRKKTDIIFELRLWNYENLESIDSDTSKNQRTLEVISESFGLLNDVIRQIPEGKGVKLLEKVYLSRSYLFQWPSLSCEIVSEVGTCYGLRQQIGILVNGDVVPCCLDQEGDIHLGNIFHEDFEDIITSDRAEKIREGFANKQLVEDLCKRCGYRVRFK